MRILAIGGHICDMEFTCGAVLAKHARLGDEVYLLSTTAGEKGFAKKDTNEYKKQKIEEGLRCAEKLGAKESIWLDYPDAELPCDIKVQTEIAEEIRRIKPDVVITHWNKATHNDHLNTAINVERAIWRAKIGAIKTEHPRHVVQRLYYAENWEDPIDFTPNVFVSVEEEDIERWQSAIKEFQVGRGETSGFQFAEYYRHLTHVRGMVAGFKHAQAFYTDFKVHTDGLFGEYNPSQLL